MKNRNIPPCPECGEQFENVFEATDHLLEDDEPEFDPYVVLPNGFKLLVGSLLRCMYRYADSADDIKEIAQSTYMTLYQAEHNPEAVSNIIEDMIVDYNMDNLDEEIKKLLENDNG